MFLILKTIKDITEEEVLNRAITQVKEVLFTRCPLKAILVIKVGVILLKNLLGHTHPLVLVIEAIVVLKEVILQEEVQTEALVVKAIAAVLAEKDINFSIKTS